MEIRDYLKILGERLRILVLVPLVAVVLVVGSIVIQPTKYQATATVAAPALVGGITANQYSGANGLKAYVANFTAFVTSPKILDAVHTETQVPKSALKSGITATQVGASSLMQVTYQSARKAKVVPVAQAAATDTLGFLFSSQVQLAQKPVDLAVKGVSDAEASLNGLINKIGLPDKTYEVKAQQLAHLQESQSQATATGSTVTAGRLQAAIDAKQGELNALAPQVQEYESLKDKKDQATATLNQARQSLQQAKAQFEAADPKQDITLGRAHVLSVVSDIIQKGGVALGAGVFLAVGLIVVLEFMVRSPGRVTERAKNPAGGEPAPSGA